LISLAISMWGGVTTMGEARAGGDRAAGLLLKALDGLPAGERQTVLQALLTGSLGAVAGGHGSLPLDEYFVVPERQPGEFEKLSSVSRMLPVRLTPESHERLRRWSTDHGFAMAVVVRGLIERFLEERAA
jgi:hypothetical protein